MRDGWAVCEQAHDLGRMVASGAIPMHSVSESAAAVAALAVHLDTVAEEERTKRLEALEQAVGNGSGNSNGNSRNQRRKR